MKSPNYSYDDNLVRYQLVKTNSANNLYNWLFLPGGPGADSSYYLGLIEGLDVPGNFWLIDFPANGSNIPSSINAEYNFDSWENCFIPAIQRFENPILVGQSFGGMFPLLFPKLEELLKGFIILNSAPTVWLTEAARYAKENNVITTTEAGIKFRANPTLETFKAALLANAHCHFTESSIEIGKKLFEKLPFNYHAMLWWIKKVQDIHFNARWIPKHVSTLIMGGACDFVVPCTIFEADRRFHRSNIQIRTIENAGHFLWIEQMSIVKAAFKSFFERDIALDIKVAGSIV